MYEDLNLFTIILNQEIRRLSTQVKLSFLFDPPWMSMFYTKQSFQKNLFLDSALLFMICL